MVLNALQEPLAKQTHSGNYPAGLGLDGLRQQSGQCHRDRFSVFKGKQQGYGIAALVEKSQLYRLAIVQSPARRELATVDDHDFESALQRCAGVDLVAMQNPRVISELSRYLRLATIVRRPALQADPGRNTGA